MNVTDLTREQLIELKQNYLSELDGSGELKEVAGLDSLGYDELARADEIVSDELIFEHYGGVSFVDDDFAKCSEEEANNV